MTKVNNAQLDYDPLQVIGLFKTDFYYAVPTYQRGYSWTKDEINELLADLDDAYRNYPDEEYLLGQIIVCPTINKRKSLPRDIVQLDLIDGQQRCTTLYIFLLRCISRVKEAISSETLELREAEKSRFREWEGCSEVIDDDDNLIPRVKAASNGEDFLKLLISDQVLPEPNGPTQVNILGAVTEIDNALEKMTPREVFDFLKFVLTQVWVVRLGLNTAEHALRVFQKVNNRGLQLDDSDLIKSYLFQSAKSDSDYALLSKQWDAATNKLYQAGNKRLRQMENLMKLLIGIRTGKSISKGALYDTWVKEFQSGDSSSSSTEIEIDKVSSFALQLPTEAQNLVIISKGQIPQDSQKSDLIQGTLDARWIQPYEILLAGAHLDAESYKNLLRIVEDRTMLSFWSKEKNNSFESIIHPWAKEVKQLDSFATLEEIRSASARAFEDFQDLSARAFLGIKSLSYNVGTHKPRMRYVLARVHNAFQDSQDVNGPTISALLRTDGGYHLDHVFPKSEGKRANWTQSRSKDQELGTASRYDQSIHSIGNLILLHPADNISQSDALPWSPEKQTNLGKSELFLNRALVDDSYWPNIDGRLAPKIRELQKKRNVEISEDKNSEELIDALAQLYWDVLSDNIKNHFGI